MRRPEALDVEARIADVERVKAVHAEFLTTCRARAAASPVYARLAETGERVVAGFDAAIAELRREAKRESRR